MKQRIFSIVLVLCLCISSRPVVHAYENSPSQGEDILTEELPGKSEKAPSRDEDVAVEGFTEESGIGDGNNVSEEDFSQKEEVSAEETTDGPDDNDDENAARQEDPSQEGFSQEEDVLTEESAEEPDTPDDGTEVLQEESSPKKNVPMKRAAGRRVTRDTTVPTPAQAYEAMIALKDVDGYKEGTTWTNDEPYSDTAGYYYWNGGTLDGKRISAVGCVAFAFILSDEAFGSLPARMYAEGGFTFDDIKVGDILRTNNDTHTVIVLEVSDVGVVVAEGNISSGDHKGKVHWGRAISKEEVMRDTSHYITRYPEGYVQPDDPDADQSIAGGTLDGGLTWNLTKAGTLTISGEGAMTDFGSAEEQPWSDNSSSIQKVVIEEGITSIGSCAFWNCGVLSAEIASSVETVGNSAFRNSSIISVTIPSGVKTIDDSAFRGCQNLSSVNVDEGLETISQNAFRGCTSLTSINLPASIEKVGSAAFLECTEMKSAAFAPGNVQVKLGDNVFTRCYYLMSVTLPKNIDRIGEGMFQNCLMLAGVEIPQGVESIETWAFASCSGMTTVIIPDSVTTIGTAAFADCPLTDVYFTGTEAQWNSINKIGDTASAVSKATIHYNYTPAVRPDPNPGDGDDDNTDDGGDDDNNDGDNPGNDDDNNGDNNGDDSGSNPGGNKPGNDSGNTSGGNNHGSSSSDNGQGSRGSDRYNNGSAGTAVSIVNSGTRAVVETWKPSTPDEKKRYACMGQEAVQYTQSKDNASQVLIENAMQGPMCFKSFEAVLGDYTIGRTYNIYKLSENAYSMDKEIQFTIQIPSAIYQKDREYKMICVTKGGQPIVYDDLDSDSETITIKTNEFYAYALIYRQKQK